MKTKRAVLEYKSYRDKGWETCRRLCGKHRIRFCDYAVKRYERRSRDDRPSSPGERAFSRRRLKDLLDRIDRFVLRLVIGARLQLGEQPERHQLKAGQDQQDAQQQQRPVRERPRAELLLIR